MNEFSLRRQWGPIPKYDRVKSYTPPKDEFIVVAGPCSVESSDQIKAISDWVGRYHGTHLRGGVYRAGTYPGNNFGLLDDLLLKSYKDAAQENNLKNIIEVLDVRLIEKLMPYCSAFQVGARQMQNYVLLRELGKTGRQIFLKRHPGSSIDEWLGAAEHLLSGGDCHPVLIERGSSTHMNHVRWDLSISAIPAVQSITKIPIICDASHGTGRRDLVKAMTMAGVAAGANGVLLEVHTDPEKSISDADQAITPNAFNSIMYSVGKIREALSWNP